MVALWSAQNRFAPSSDCDSMRGLRQVGESLARASWMEVGKQMSVGQGVQALGLICFAVLLCSSEASAQEQPRLNLMPLPASVQTGRGSLRIDSSFSVALSGHSEARLDRAVQRFLWQLARGTGLPLSAKPSSKPPLAPHADHSRTQSPQLAVVVRHTLEICT